MRLACYQFITVTKAMLPMMVGVVACGLCQLAQYGLSLKYGAVAAMALALVAVCNQVAAAGQDHMLVELFV
jgi:hypothetical protein